MQPDDKIMARLRPGCICMGIKLHRILEAIEHGATSFEEIADITGIGQGDCGGKRCGKKVAQLLQKSKNEVPMHTQPIIHRIVTGDYQVNTYIVSCPDTQQGFIIDPGGDAEQIISYVQQNNIQAGYILNTHGHADHILANQQLKKELDLKICMHEEDASFFCRPDNLELEKKELGLSIPGTADITLKEGEIVQVGTLQIKVIHTPGHTPGSACFLVNGNLFTGDTLFVGDVGRSDLAGGSFQTLLQSIKEKIIILPLDTQIWPGHDYGEMPTSTLAWEMEENPYITDFILAEE